MRFISETKFLKTPIIEISRGEKGKYKSIIRKLAKRGITTVTLKEYNKKIVDFCNKKNIIVEDEAYYIPMILEEKIKEIFSKEGALNIGVLYEKDDIKIAEKTIIRICRYARFLSIPKLSRSNNVAEKIFNLNGLRVNIENSIEKILKKCDIIIDVSEASINKGG
jgi:hypothetical protein